MNHQQHIDQLLEKFKRNACTVEELQELYRWLDHKAAAGEAYSFTSEEEKLLMKARMQAAIAASVNTAAPVRKMKRYAWVKYAAAAAIILLIGSSITYVITRPREIIIAAAPGKIEKAQLPDGSTVWLNDNTEISYYSNFAQQRTIVLKKGEAFFEVKKDAAHPFTVQSREVNTTVKGTSFSVKMINNTGDIKVSVVTGKVLVHNQQDTLGMLLPGQRLRYASHKAQTAIDSVQTGEANGWLQGEVFLQNASLQEVTQWLHDHFNVSIENKRSDITGEYYLQVKRDITLQEVIRILNLLGTKDHIRFSLSNQTVIIQ